MQPDEARHDPRSEAGAASQTGASAQAAPSAQGGDPAQAGDRPSAEALAALAESEPVAVVEQGGVRFTLLGTAHVSRASAELVTRMVRSGVFDAVAIELDQGRYATLTDSQSWQRMDLFKVIREGKGAMLAVSLALSAYQQRLADQFGIEPGAEMRAAIDAAKGARLPLLLVDRDIGVTLRRVTGNLGWWRRLMLASGLLASVFSNEKIDEDDIERLKEGDILESTFTEFAESSEEMYLPLITERDQYMVSKLLLQSGAGQATPRHREVLVVIGAGHLKGVRAGLEAGGRVPGLPEAPGADPADARATLARLEEVPPPSRLVKALPWLVVALILAGFVIGFARSPDLGLGLLSDWALINASLAGIGALVALAHPVTIVASALASPFTSLNPLVGVGMVAAGTELWLRRPSVGDFEALKKDITTWRGWWRNRAARALLVFVTTTLFGATATWIAGARLFGRLLG